jgi:hypothetical protein
MMAFDRDLDFRGKLVRSLGALRDLLPGSLVERQRQCGKPNGRCADGKQLPAELQISVRIDGQRKTFHVPAELAEEACNQVEMHKRFQKAAATICQINLRRFLGRRREKEKGSP